MSSGGSSSSNFHHRSSLKQSNKPFKGTTKAKSAVARGKIDQKTLVSSNSGINLMNSISKVDRKNQSKLKQLIRKSELSDLRKMFHGVDGVPRTVALIPLTPNANPFTILQGLYKGAGMEYNIQASKSTLYVETFKQNIRFFCPDRNNLLQVIDSAAGVDTLLFVVSAKDECIDELGVDLLEVLRAQGMCTAVACIQDLESSVKSAKQHELRLSWLNSLTYHLASTLHPRLFSSDHFEIRRESVEMLRIISQMAIYEGISWRDTHPYLVAEKTEIIEAENETKMVLRISGRVRGSRAFSVNQIVHIPGIGDFQLSKLSAISTRRSSKNLNSMQTESNEFVAVSIPDPEHQEQLFNFKNLINEHVKNQQMEGIESESREKIIVRVPKGTSAYQARIIHEAGLDSDNENETDSDSEGDREGDHSVIDEKSILRDSIENTSDEELTDVDINEQDDSKKVKDREDRETEEALQDYAAIKRRQLDESEPLSKFFPDAVEVPEDQSARSRFSKYRGVESLRTSEWDTSADVAPDYLDNIFEFDNFKLSMKRALTVNQNDENNVNSHYRPGALIQMDLCLDNFLESQTTNIQLIEEVLNRPLSQVPLCIFGLLAHEQKYSVLNFNIQPRSTAVVRNKEAVLMIYGFRRLEVSPVYSDASHGHNLHLMNRIMPTDRSCTASVLAPIAYPPTSVLFFKSKDSSNNCVSLLASGSLESVKANRKILKRITFIGYPFKINRRTCTVRFMFFNPADVNWFRPIELITSRQFRRGHIKESLGTHGYMKCIFDNQIQQNEQIAMHLYKRIYPKWLTRTCNLTTLAIQNDRPESKNENDSNSMEL